MLREFLRWILRIFKSAAASTEAINTLSTSKPDNIATTQEKVQEEKFFTQANNLIAEFKADPTPVYAGISDNIVGYIINEKLYSTDGTVMEFEKEELLHDDVDFLKGKWKPDLTKEKKLFIIEPTPTEVIKKFEQNRKQEESEDKAKKETEEKILIELQKQAKINFPEYKEKWEDKTEEDGLI